MNADRGAYATRLAQRPGPEARNARGFAAVARVCGAVLVLASPPAAPADRSPLLDQWALERAGFAPPSEAGSTDSRPAGTPVVVAVIDSGLDYSHPDLPSERLWRNPGETPNGRDDDGDGRVDDLIGWNFVSDNNDPADTIGHGTHVAGLIAAAGGDSVEIMPLEILEAGGKGRATSLVEAILYAIAHGAQIINLSIGGQGISATERLAIDYAVDSDVLVVVAAGNAAANTVNYGPAGVPGVLSVAATDREDRRLGFSNFGQAVQIAAPGVDILSLRAAGTDLNLALRVDGYMPGAAFVGSEQRHYRATGTSFAAPLVSAAAASIWSRNPGLTNVQIARMLLMSADDVETPGWDLYTGAGRLNAARALEANPDWYLVAQVLAVEPVRRDGETLIEVRGSAGGSHFAGYRLELGQGPAPVAWKRIGRDSTSRVTGVLGTVPIGEITAPGTWTVRVVARDAAGAEREARGTLSIR